MRKAITLSALFILATLIIPANAPAQQINNIAVFDIENTKNDQNSWLGPCLTSYAIEAINTAPGYHAYSRGEIRRQLESLEGALPPRVPFERKDAALDSLGGGILLEGDFTINGSKFSFRGTLISSQQNLVKDISFTSSNYTLEKIQAELLKKISSAISKPLKNNQRSYWKTASRNAYTLHWQALWLYENSKPEQAYSLLEKAAAADPKFVEPRILSARINMEKTLLSKAAEQLEKCLQISPNNPQANYQLGLVYFLMHRNNEAKTYLKAAASAAPNNPEYHLQLAILYKNMLQPDKALEELTTAVRKSPGLAQAWYELSTIHALAGNTSTALDCLEKALKHGRAAYLNKATNDSDFNRIRQEKRFKEILRRYQ